MEAHMRTKREILAVFSSLSPEIKKYVLSSLAHQITVCARAAYPEERRGSAPEVARDSQEKLRSCNELEHTVTGQLTHLLARDNKSYDDADFINILFDKAQLGSLEKEIAWAFQFALDHLTPPMVHSSR
jgi:hypothetical protein